MKKIELKITSSNNEVKREYFTDNESLAIYLSKILGDSIYLNNNLAYQTVCNDSYYNYLEDIFGEGKLLVDDIEKQTNLYHMCGHLFIPYHKFIERVDKTQYNNIVEGMYDNTEFFKIGDEPFFEFKNGSKLVAELINEDGSDYEDFESELEISYNKIEIKDINLN